MKKMKFAGTSDAWKLKKKKKDQSKGSVFVLIFHPSGQLALESERETGWNNYDNSH